MKYFLKNSDMVESLNTQTNLNNQLKSQYSNLLKVNLFFEVSLDMYTMNMDSMSF